MAIYTEKFKGATAGMLKYMDVIRELARNNGDWKGYDQKFRKMKMQQKLGWGCLIRKCILGLCVV
jgi:hypothetical protein